MIMNGLKKINDMKKMTKKSLLDQTPIEFKKLEDNLQKNLGFKRKWLDDNSGSWLEKSYDFINSKIYLDVDWDNPKPVYVYARSNKRTEGTYFSYLDLIENSKGKLNYESIKKLDSKFTKVSNILK